MPAEITPRLLGIPAALAKRYARPGTDAFDELVAEGLLELVKAARRWRPGAGAAPGSYCWRAVATAVAYAAGRGSRRRYTQARRWARLSPLPHNPADRRPDPRLLVDAADAARAALSKLPPLAHAAYALRHGHGMTHRAIGLLFGRSRAWAEGEVRKAEKMVAAYAGRAR